MESATTPKKKNKNLKWIIGGIVVILILVGLIAYFRPFVWQKKDWLIANATTQFTAAQYGLMTDAEIETAYMAICTYAKKIPATDTATTAAWAALKTKYAPNTATF